MRRPPATRPSDPGECLAVSFTCLDCGARLTRFVRNAADDVRRCFACEAALTRRVSARLLSLVFDS
jgi:hypothetical protein